jgi:hypothetical protein
MAFEELFLHRLSYMLRSGFPPTLETFLEADFHKDLIGNLSFNFELQGLGKKVECSLIRHCKDG